MNEQKKIHFKVSDIGQQANIQVSTIAKDRMMALRHIDHCDRVRGEVPEIKMQKPSITLQLGVQINEITRQMRTVLRIPEYDKNGFAPSGIHRKTGTKYDPHGYDRYGYDKNDWDCNGYNKYGFNRQGFNREGYDVFGFDKYGFDCYGFDHNGFNLLGYNHAGHKRYWDVIDLKQHYSLWGYTIRGKKIKHGPFLGPIPIGYIDDPLYALPALKIELDIRQIIKIEIPYTWSLPDKIKVQTQINNTIQLAMTKDEKGGQQQC